MKHSVLLKVALVGVVGAFLIAMAPSPARDVTASVGSPAPDFTLEDQDGNKVSLSDYSGRVVVLEWFNYDCPFVQRHYKAETFVKLANKFKDQGVVWLTINTTHYVTKADNKKYKEKMNLPYSILSDPTGEVGKMYGAQTTPHMYIIDQGGKLVYAGGIDDDPKGQLEKPNDYVKQALKEILAGNPVSTPESEPYGCSVKYAKK
jgi:peroxiredoxin